LVQLHGAELKGRTLQLKSLPGPAEYERCRNDALWRGL